MPILYSRFLSIEKVELTLVRLRRLDSLLVHQRESGGRSDENGEDEKGAHLEVLVSLVIEHRGTWIHGEASFLEKKRKSALVTRLVTSRYLSTAPSRSFIRPVSSLCHGHGSACTKNNKRSEHGFSLRFLNPEIGVDNRVWNGSVKNGKIRTVECQK